LKWEKELRSRRTIFITFLVWFALVGKHVLREVHKWFERYVSKTINVPFKYCVSFACWKAFEFKYITIFDAISMF